MDKLYKKSKLTFSIVWIIIYCLLFSIADSISIYLGISKSITVIVGLVISIFLIIWLKKNNLLKEYGITKAGIEFKKMFYYIPLILLIIPNLMFGINIDEKYSILEIVLYIVSMILVGFLEELIFRGFLFTSLKKEGIKTAIIISSITFGMGHIINLVTGNSNNLIFTLIQIEYATMVGFLFTIIFYKTKNLIPCIVAHSLVNSLSILVDTSMLSLMDEIIVALIWTIISITYSVYIIKKFEVVKNGK